MKTFLRLILGVIIILGFHHNVLAQGAIKIGVVDIEKLRQKSVAFEKGRAEYNKKVAELEKKLREEGEALQKLQEEYQKQSMMLSLDAQEDKRKELLSKSRLYKFHGEDYTAQAFIHWIAEMNHGVSAIRPCPRISLEILQNESA